MLMLSHRYRHGEWRKGRVLVSAQELVPVREIVGTVEALLE